MSKGDWENVNWHELSGITALAAFTGMMRALYLLRKGRRFVWFDFVIDPCMAIIGGVCMWALMEVTNSPDLIQLVVSWIGAWGGPRTINYLELKYFGDNSRHVTPIKE